MIVQYSGRIKSAPLRSAEFSVIGGHAGGCSFVAAHVGRGLLSRPGSAGIPARDGLIKGGAVAKIVGIQPLADPPLAENPTLPEELT